MSSYNCPKCKQRFTMDELLDHGMVCKGGKSELRVNLSEMTIEQKLSLKTTEELKELCKKHDIPCTGYKTQLVNRLSKADLSQKRLKVEMVENSEELSNDEEDGPQDEGNGNEENTEERDEYQETFWDFLNSKTVPELSKACKFYGLPSSAPSKQELVRRLYNALGTRTKKAIEQLENSTAKELFSSITTKGELNDSLPVNPTEYSLLFEKLCFACIGVKKVDPVVLLILEHLSFLFSKAVLPDELCEESQKKLSFAEFAQMMPKEKKARVEQVNQFLKQRGTFHIQQELPETPEATDIVWDTGEAYASINERRLARLEFRDKLSRDFSSLEYQEWSQACKANFVSKRNPQLFETWAKLDRFPLKMATSVLEIIGQLIYDFIDISLRRIFTQFGSISISNLLNFLSQ